MKTLKVKPFAWLCLLSLIVGCKSGSRSEFETVPFEANFMTLLASMEGDPQCAAPMNILNIQEGHGSATLLGEFTTQIAFCIDTSTLEYGNCKGTFIAENGDALFFTGSGQVRPSEEPGYDLEFKDSFRVTGGSGRFEGATGTLTSNSFVNMTTQQTDHVWSGTIKIRKDTKASSTDE